MGLHSKWFFKQHKMNRQSSGAGAKQMEFGKLDESLMGLQDLYDLDSCVVFVYAFWYMLNLNYFGTLPLVTM